MLSPQFDNLATSSFLLYLDDRICSRSGYYNISSNAYKMPQVINGYSTYTFPYAQIISNYNISGVNQLSGIYINNSWITRGQSGFSGVNFDKGQIFIDPNNAPTITNISGNYAIKDINVVLADFPDISVLFEQKQQLRSKVPFAATGIANNIVTYPIIFIENANAPTNTPWEIGGVDQSRVVFNLYFFCESVYQKNALMTILRDMSWKYIPLLAADEMPFNNLGDYKNGNIYNYSTLTSNHIDSGQAMLIESVDLEEYGRHGILADIQKLTTEAYFGLVTVTAWARRVTT